MAPAFELVGATESDAAAIATCLFEAYNYEPQPQAKFYAHMMPHTPATHKFITDLMMEQMRAERSSLFVKAVDSNADEKLAGFIKWTPPGSPKTHGPDPPEDIDEELLKTLQSNGAEYKAKLMGDRPYWYLELMGVRAEYQRHGVGSLLVEYGCQMADEAGLEAYVTASPAARPLYARFGFEEMNKRAMPAPFEWYIQSYMVRPGKF